MPRLVAAALIAPMSVIALAGPDQSPPVPDAILDLRTAAGAAAAQAEWRYVDASIVEVAHRAPGADHKPSGLANRTHDISPHAGAPDFDDSAWTVIGPEDLETRRSSGRLAFGWCRLDFTIPDAVGGLAVRDSSVYFETVVDDYAEVWIDGSLARVLGESRGQLIGGWNSPTRVRIPGPVEPGRQVSVAIFAANGPLSDPPPNYIWIRSATLDFYGPGRDGAATAVAAQITRNDPALDAILAPGAQVERLADGFAFTEGPVWVPATGDDRYGGGGRGGYLLFSDPNKNVIHRWSEADGVSIFRTKSGYTGTDIGLYHQPGSNGLALDQEGRLTICEHGNRRVTRLEKDGSLTVLADRYGGQRLNSPNDLVYRSDGALFFTDPPFGLPGVFDDPGKETPYSGVYCLYNGELKLVSTELAAPNGLAFSPDEKHLYVDNWEESRKVVLVFDVGPDGSLANARTFFDMTDTPGEIALDGLKVDSRGNVFVSGPGGVWIISPNGKHLGTLSPPQLPANFAFGDADGQTLYMTARSDLYRVRIGIAGTGGHLAGSQQPRLGPAKGTEKPSGTR